jgi:tRNA(Ile)-lysidine synthase
MELRNEGEARAARYEFLRDAAARTGADRIVTAHHADDQAETVLFRILRGTGLAGLGGIPARTRSLIRPLLSFWRAEIESYALERGLSWRSDPTNETYGPVRNRIRHEILPRIEIEVSRSAKENLVRLADQARESERGWREIVEPVFHRVVRIEAASLSIDREALGAEGWAVATRVLRKALRRLGIVPDRSGTRLALTFISDAPSGREMQLASGVRIRIEFDRARLYRERSATEDTVLSIVLPDEDQVVAGSIRLGGRTMLISARRGTDVGTGPQVECLWRTRVPVPIDRFPLTVRSRAAGDRVQTRGGTKSLKKLMIEARVPSSERGQRPVVVDSNGQVVWVPGLPVIPPEGAGGLPIDLMVANA